MEKLSIQIQKELSMFLVFIFSFSFNLNSRSELLHDDKEQNTEDELTETLGSMVHLLCHEVQKMYGERLWHQTDYEWLMNRIQEEVNASFGSEAVLQGMF